MSRIRFIVEDGENWGALGNYYVQVHYDASDREFYCEEASGQRDLDELPECGTRNCYALDNPNDLRALADVLEAAKKGGL